MHFRYSVCCMLWFRCTTATLWLSTFFSLPLWIFPSLPMGGGSTIHFWNHCPNIWYSSKFQIFYTSEQPVILSLKSVTKCVAKIFYNLLIYFASLIFVCKNKSMNFKIETYFFFFNSTKTFSFFSSDLWALGCIIYQLHSGLPPFWGK